MKLAKISTLFSFNITVVGVILFLQYLMYGFAPSISPRSLDKKEAALQNIYEMNLTLFLETVLGIGIIIFINWLIIGRKKPVLQLIILMFDLLIICFSAYHYSLSYYRNFVID
jgi:hypothetical protein